MRSVSAWLPFSALLLLAGGCRSAVNEAARAGGPLAAEEVAAIRAADSGFASAAQAGDAAAVAALYATDARLLPPNAPVVEGREAIQKFWGGFLDTYGVTLDLASEEVEGRGDLAYARGRYTLDGTPKAAGAPPLHDVGKYLEVMRRGADGRWLIAVDMYSSDLPVAK